MSVTLTYLGIADAFLEHAWQRSSIMVSKESY
jgi:hypothetical protein